LIRNLANQNKDFQTGLID